MSHIPDMAVGPSGRTAVGWLHPDHPFPQADASPEFVARLRAFAARWGESVHALGWGVRMGFHTCEFCDAHHASGSFGVPDGTRIFWAPDIIAHYVERHRYAPPAEFVAAVMACPLPGTPEYAEAVRPFAWHHTRGGGSANE